MIVQSVVNAILAGNLIRSAKAPVISAGVMIANMLDVYFATRYLQLRHDIPDDPSDRSTAFVLSRLRDRRVLATPQYEGLIDGYEFLSALDHGLRLTVGRRTRVPLADQAALATIAGRMRLDSAQQLLEKLAVHRLLIREAFDNILPE